MESNIVTILSFLTQRNLQIPEYQRPYKWGVENVN